MNIRYMSLTKTILIGLIALLSVFIVYSFWMKRQSILLRWKKTSEAYDGSSEEGFTNSLSPLMSITNVASGRADLPLIEYCIKASYNSAFDGRNMTMMALETVISRGCRFLDFEIFTVDGVPSVAYSVDSTFSTLSSGNSLPLQDVLNEVVGNCFMGNVPNPRDPLFIHLRIKTKCGINNQHPCDVYQQVATILHNTLLPVLHVDKDDKAIPVSGSTLLSDITGKVVVAMDASVNRDYKDYAVCEDETITCYNLQDYVNIETGGNVWKRFYFTDFINKKEINLAVDSTNSMVAEPTTGTLSLQLALPDKGLNVNNSSFPLSNIVSFGCQTVAFKFYKKDASLKEYEALFDNYKTAFVPLGFVVDYIQNKKM